MRVNGTERACPRCGKPFLEELKFECPYCGELIPRKSTKCPFCELDVSKFSSEPPQPAIEQKLDDLLENLIVEEAARVKDEAKRYSCPECAWLLDGTEARCPKCGLEFSGEVKIACPICGASVGKDLKTCPICGSLLHPVSAPREPIAAPQRAPMPVSQPSPAPQTEVPRPEGLREKAREQSMAPKPVTPEVPSPPPPRQVEEKSPKEEDEQEEDSPEEALGVLGEIARQELSRKPKTRKLKSDGKVTSVTGPKGRSADQGLSNGLGQVNGAGQARGAGRTNGSGRVNGRVNGRTNGTGRVNGMGAVNGRSLVNGTGVSNGLRGRPKGSLLGRADILFRWQFLVVLVAVMVAIPTFLFFSTREHDLYSIDGDFGDWKNAPKFGASVQSSSPSIDISEWAVGTDGNGLYLYLRTGAAIMDSDIVESVFLFVDSDGSNSTGYLVGALGADYLMQIDGWNGSVQSADLLGRAQGADGYDWNAWTSAGGLSARNAGNALEAMAVLSFPLGQKAQFMLMTKDSQERTSTSYPAPLQGGMLIVRQELPPDIADDGIIQTVNPATLLRLRFICEGVGGSVQSVTPTVTGGVSPTSGPFSLEPGGEHILDVTSDLSSARPGQLVAAYLEKRGISSSFSSIEIEGQGSKAYVSSAPADIVIDGAFGDWVGRRIPDQDPAPVTDPCIDINETGNVSTSSASYFYVSVKGEIWNGSYVPAARAKPSSGGGGGNVVPTRKTGEDVLNIYIDSDRSSSTGLQMLCDSKLIGADHKLELKGLGGRITSSAEYDFASGSWAASTVSVSAAKDETSVEISIASSALGGSSDIDFIVETTSWKSPGDLATYRPMSGRGLVTIQTWPVTGALTSPYATSMSYQRKIFYDGTNIWSFYFDGSDTVFRYSTDLGATWTLRGSVFHTSGVNETSVWYDSANGAVYAVGDTAAASQNVCLQKGTVNTGSHNINWAASDSTLTSSSNALGGKNAFISRDSNGYIWVLSSNYSNTQPKRYDLTAFKSTAVNSVAAWAYSGQMLGAPASEDTVKGSIVPAGSGSDMWGVYTYSGVVASRKFTGTWQNPQTTIMPGGGSGANTENSPPSVVVDSKGVAQVVWGTSRTKTGTSLPSINYAHNNTGATMFSASVDLDPLIPADVGDFYPTISLDTSTGDLYAIWLRADTGSICRTVMIKKCVSGTWSDVTLEPQTSYPKQFLTSVYSISGQYMICWQWTQNTTGSVQVVFDRIIPEFSDVALPVMFMMVLVAVYRSRARKKS